MSMKHLKNRWENAEELYDNTDENVHMTTWYMQVNNGGKILGSALLTKQTWSYEHGLPKNNWLSQSGVILWLNISKKELLGQDVS